MAETDYKTLSDLAEAFRSQSKLLADRIADLEKSSDEKIADLEKSSDEKNAEIADLHIEIANLKSQVLSKSQVEKIVDAKNKGIIISFCGVSFCFWSVVNRLDKIIIGVGVILVGLTVGFSFSKDKMVSRTGAMITGFLGFACSALGVRKLFVAEHWLQKVHMD